VLHIVEHRPSPYRRPSSRGRTDPVPPPPLAGDLPGRTTATNQSLVSQIDDPRSLFACRAPPRRQRVRHRRRA
jgi:hypothetical protein